MRRVLAIPTLALWFLVSLLALQAQDSESTASVIDASTDSPAAHDTYVVQAGDSLYALAQRFSTTVDALAETNDIQAPGELRAGQSIRVPAAARSYLELYEIQPGDTLFNISKRFNTSIGLLQGLNNILDGRQIIAGQTILVPSLNQAEVETHLVAPEDSLFSIARRYNTAVSLLMSLNGIADPRDLQVGASILVPKTDATRYEVYEVTAGDSLYSLSRRFATTEAHLISLNGLTGPRDLEVGQTILVPLIDEIKFEVYEIKPGDTLFSISRRYNTTVAQLRALNGISGDLDMAIGRSILVPRVDESLFDSIVVQAGDSLYTIAQRYGVSLPVLQALNGLPNPRDLRVGQTILAPTLEDAVLEIYTVGRGDNLTKIADAYGTTVDFLQLLNGIADPSLLQLDEILLVPVAKGVSARPGFGFGLQVFADVDNASALAAQVSQLGVDWVKIDVPWAAIEAEPGIYDYAALDATVAAMELADVNILLNVFDAPAWSRAAYTEKLNSQLRDYGGPPQDLDDFATFLANIATRYAGIVDAYEIWKSPNLLKFWTVPVYEREPELNADGDYGIPDEVQLGAAFYLPLLQLAFETIKAHDEQALVISGGLAPVGFSDGYNSIDTVSYLEDLLALGAADFSDAVGAVFSASAVPPTLSCCDKPPGVESHYESFLQYFPELMEFYAEVLVENDLARTPIVVTQVGWGTRDGANIAVPSSGFEWLNYTNEDEQALYVTQAYEIVQAMDSISAMFLYNLNGCAAGDAEACFFSLVDAAGALRPAYAAFAAIPKSAD